MRRVLLVSAALIVGYTVTARAQNAMGTIKLADVAGTWDSKTIVGPTDSVAVRSVITATADGKGWTLKLPKGDRVPLRIVTVGGDSIVTEAGPFPSALRPGQTVTLLHSIAHYKGDKSTGTFEAHYSSGDVVRGKTEATRRK
ncbi:MAG TPA: hypothetical protein VNW46_04505 [Gemmatimonadaceae bacterium]|jgi:hypothetical protein|nr:hypothetical protein [Gemmatimonadaceae bacterium]